MEEKTKDGGKGFRRRTFLVDRHFQIKYTIIIVLVGAIVSILFGLLLYKAHLENTRLISMQAFDNERLATAIQSIDQGLLYYLAVFVIILIVALFIWGILITHKVAGPIYYISTLLDSITKEKLPSPRPLRKGDEMQEFYSTTNKMIDFLKNREMEQVTEIEDILKGIEGGDTDSSRARLRQMREKKLKFLSKNRES